MDLSESEPVFTSIMSNLKSYENKEELELKKVAEGQNISALLIDQ